MLTTCLRQHIFQICANKFQNCVYLCFGKVLKLKVTKGELIILNGLEMADAYLPPALVRVKMVQRLNGDNKTLLSTDRLL